MNTAFATSPFPSAFASPLDVLFYVPSGSLEVAAVAFVSPVAPLSHLPLRVSSGLNVPRPMWPYRASNSRDGPAIMSLLCVITDLSPL